MSRPDDPGEPATAPPGDRVLRPVLVVAGLAFAALALRPSTGLLAVGHHAPLHGLLWAVLLLCAAWVDVAYTLNARYRGAARFRTGLPPRADRLRDLTLRLLPAAMLLLPLALLVSYFAAQPKPALTQQQAPADPPLGPAQPPTPPPHLDEGGDAVVETVLTVLLALLVLGAAVLLWRQLRHRRPAARTARPAPRTTEQQFAEAVDSGRRALLGSDARAAVIACYAAMEESLAGSGVGRLAADSPAELLERAVAAGSVPGAEGAALTELFREARFSRHPMGQAELDRARAALDVIARRLAQAAADRPVETSS
ncbi:DUF4129 domain-containing protein [Kitasatospora sp. NPDC006697]|uniref:DUF4129 domain-containing protein n=1 Tax=Kitasatospora sp. NPDC006697 TaxID=3364020 RepID=UPI003693212A